MDIVLAQLIRLKHNLAHRDEKGATAVEYGLLVGLIAAVIIAAVVLLGTQINDLFTSITDELGA